MRYFMLMIRSFHRNAPARAAETKGIPSNRYAALAGHGNQGRGAAVMPKDTAARCPGKRQAGSGPQNPQARSARLRGCVDGTVAGRPPRLPCAGPDASFGPTGEPDARDRRRPSHARYDIDGLLEHDRRRAGHDRHAARAAALARLFLVLAGAQQAAARQVGRRGRDAAQRGRRDRRRGRLRQAAHPADRRAAPRPAITARRCRSKAACCSISPT